MGKHIMYEIRKPLRHQGMKKTKHKKLIIIRAAGLKHTNFFEIIISSTFWKITVGGVHKSWSYVPHPS